MRRNRNVKIVATLGPASSDMATIRALFDAGADVFRLNMSHGSHAEIAARHAIVRQIEKDTGRPIALLADLQGPKLRVGTFAVGAVELEEGERFRFDLDETEGDHKRVTLPHPEIFAALQPGASLLVNDGKIRLKVEDCGDDYADCVVVVGGVISNRKGVNVPDVVLPLRALSDKDKADLEFVCDLGVDWLALSFVQRPEDVEEARELARGRAAILAKIEKPAAVNCFDDIAAVSDGIMVARGDLGVELPVSCSAADPEAVGAALAGAGQAGDRGHADDGIDDRKPDADTGRSVGCGHRDLRGGRRGDALGGIGGGQLPGRGRAHDAQHRAVGGKGRDLSAGHRRFPHL